MPPQPANFRPILLSLSMIAAVVTIPLDVNLNSKALIVFGLAAAVQQPLRTSLARLRRKRLWVLPVVYFCWLAGSYFWDTAGGYSIKDLERYAVLLLLPPVFAMLPTLAAGQIRRLCYWFTASVATVCVYCLITAYRAYLTTADYRVFYYHYLAGQANLNAIFLSNYCLASMVMLLYFLFEGKALTAFQIAASVFTCGFLFTMVIFLSSKLIIVLMGLMLTAMLVYLAYLHGYIIRTVLVLALIIFAGVMILRNTHYVQWRFSELRAKQYSGPEDNHNGLAIRMLMWRSAVELIARKPLQGYGIRGAREEILKKYKQKGFMLGYLEKYHSHNQYLESALMAGLPALALFLAMLLWMGVRSLRTRNLLLVILLLQFSLQCFIESAYEVQQELVFYLFFLLLFYYHPPPVIAAKTLSA